VLTVNQRPSLWVPCQGGKALEAARIVPGGSGNPTVPWDSHIIGVVTWVNKGIPPDITTVVVGYFLGNAAEGTYVGYQYDPEGVIYICASRAVIWTPDRDTTVTTDVYSRAWPFTGTFDAHIWVGRVEFYPGELDYRNGRAVGIALDAIPRITAYALRWFTGALTIYD